MPDNSAGDDRPRKDHRASAALDELFEKLAERGKQRDFDSPTWNSLVTSERFQDRMGQSRRKARDKLPLPNARINWELLCGFGTNAHKALRFETNKRYDGIRPSQVADVASILKEFGFGTRAPAPTPDDPKSWELFFRAALREVLDEIAESERQGSSQSSTVSSRPSGRHHRVDSVQSANRPTSIPIDRPPYFFGREHEIEAIDAALASDHHETNVVALHGLRGVGKSVLAAAFAHNKAANYLRTWWLRAHSEITLREDLASLGASLGWVKASDKDESSVPIVLKRLSGIEDRILLVFDGALDPLLIRSYLRDAGRTDAIITSTAPGWGGFAKQIEVEVWKPDVGAEFLIARIPRSDNAYEQLAAQALSKKLGGLPLAHEQAAAYCAHYGIDFVVYGARFDTAKIGIFHDEQFAPADYRDDRKARLTVARTFALAIDAAKESDAAAEPLIELAAHLAPDPVPLFLLCHALSCLGVPVSATPVSEGLDETIAALRTFALIERESLRRDSADGEIIDTVRLHPLVREVAAARATGAQALKACLVRSVETLYPKDGFDSPTSWQRCRSLTPHVLELWRAAKGAMPAPMGWPALLDRIVGYLHGSAFYHVSNAALDTPSQANTQEKRRAGHAQAIALMREVIALTEAALGPDHPNTATALNSLADLLREQGSYIEALPLLRRALAIRERAFGPNAVAVADSLSSLGGLLNRLRNRQEARAMLERAVAIQKSHIGSAEAAAALNNLAFSVGRADRRRSIELYRQALAIEEQLQPGGLNVAAILNNLGELLISQDNEEAREFLSRALSINERYLDPMHPDIAMNHNNLGLLCQAEGDLPAARIHFDKAIEIAEHVLGPTDWRLASARANLALLLYQMGDSDWRALSESAVQIATHGHPQRAVIVAGHVWMQIFWHVPAWVKRVLVTAFLIWMLWSLVQWSGLL